MKSTILKSLIALIFLVIFNVIFFVGDIINHSEANWYSYGFITAAYLLLLLTSLLTKGSTSGVLVGSLWLRALSYFFTELVVGIICICIDPEKIAWPLIIQGSMLSIFLVMQFMSVMANDATNKSIRQQKEDSFQRQMLIDQLQMKRRLVSDPEVKMLLNHCLDALSNTPIQTFPEAWEADLTLSNAVNALCDNLEGNTVQNIKPLADKMLYAVQMRNIAIKRCRMR